MGELGIDIGAMTQDWAVTQDWGNDSLFSSLGGGTRFYKRGQPLQVRKDCWREGLSSISAMNLGFQDSS